MRVLDFSTLLPGPYATLNLADLGARVLRVESPTRADLVREFEPQVAGQSAAFQYLNRGKASLALDLKHPQASEVIERLLADYDILVEQFRPGVMARLGLDYDTLKARHPGLIYCSLTGYGQDGPYAQRAGHDINYLALAGISGYSGRSGEAPAPCGIQIADLAAGAQNATIAILAAVIERQQTGQGQWLDISMLDGSLALNALFGPGALTECRDPAPEGNLLNGGGIYDHYRTADGRYLAVGSLEPVFRRRLCDALEIENGAAMLDGELKPRLAECIAARPLEHWQQVFADVDACVEPVLTLNELESHPQVRARGLLETRQVGEQALTRIASPFRFDGERPGRQGLAPRCGAQNRAVMNELGYSEAQLEAFGRDGLFGPSSD
nr:CaiB/BaiF CoA-transferase family protein [Motiliproteus sp. SC1-56]